MKTWAVILLGLAAAIWNHLAVNASHAMRRWVR